LFGKSKIEDGQKISMKLHSQLDCNVVLSYLLGTVLSYVISFTANLYELVSGVSDPLHKSKNGFVSKVFITSRKRCKV
jgi:hypothetical protein